MPIQKRTRGGDLVLLCVSLVFLAAPAWLGLFRHAYSNAAYFTSTAIGHPAPRSNGALAFWEQLQDALKNSKPSIPPLSRIRPKDWPWIAFDREKQPSGPRFENYDLSDQDLADLSTSRLQGLKHAQQGQHKLPFVPGTRGIVSTAPPNAFGIQTTQLWMIREVGSVLPVEVWIWDRSEWEEAVCDEVYPALGAKCMVMTDHYPPDLPPPFHGNDTFVFKSLAMLFSTFEQVLFLDNDCFPVNNPDSVFTSKPFTIAGLVLWPDLWADTTSKYWHKLTNRPIPDIRDRATTEAGQILINKATHAGLLILAHFYIYNGKDYFYHLLSQGAMGQGDKDVWLAAAFDLQLPWYQVNERPQRIGYRCGDRSVPVGTAHSHPLDDFMYASHGIIRHSGGFDFGESIHPRILFLHHNMPKPGAMYLVNSAVPSSPWAEALYCKQDNGNVVAHRMWGPEDLALIKYGWDPEKAFWRGLRWAACVHRRDFKIWNEVSIYLPKEKLEQDLCAILTNHWNNLFPKDTWTASVPKFGARPEILWGGMKAQ